MRKRRTLITLASMILLLSVVTLAYYTGGLSNDNAQTASLSIGTMELTFADGDNGIAAAITFGGTITKKFTLTNTGTLDASASISWFNLINTYLDGSLMYSLEYSENIDGEYEPIVSNLMVPTSEEAITTPLVTQLTIPAKKAEEGNYVDNTYYYNLHITLVNSPIIDQTADINANFHTQFTLSDATSLSASEQTLANLGLVVSNKTADFTKPAGSTYKDNGFSMEEKTYNVSSSYINDTIYYSTTYTFDESTGLYKLATLKRGIYEDIISALNNGDDVYISGRSNNAAWDLIRDRTNIDTIFKITSASYDSSTNTGSWTYLEPNDTTLPDYSTTGIYSMEDDYGTSYYFRGIPENNYVKFAGYYWRIVRVNGDGSLRIIYDGTKGYQNGINVEDYSQRIIANVKYANNRSNRAVGYMYGLELEKDDTQERCLMLDENDNVVDNISIYTDETACTNARGKWTTNAYEATHANVKDSNIKTVIDEWYQTNIYDKGYSNAISDTLFCNDRNIQSGSGIGENTTMYKTYGRLNTNNNHIPTPQLICTQKNDRFTASDTIVGNGDLTYPIGLINADEMVISGAMAVPVRLDDPNAAVNISDSSINKMFFINRGYMYWSMSPVEFFENNFQTSTVFYLNGDGKCSPSLISSNVGVVPVLNLTPEYVSQMIGDGTIGNEFRVE